MGSYDLCKALHRVIASREAGAAVRAGDFGALASLALDPEERRAIEHADFVRLYRLGAHPLLLFHFATVIGSRERYVREVVPRLQGVPNPFYDYYLGARDQAYGH
ncbi:MAG: hypothetical protein QN174_02925 [Armatimonadota bacterium]|nr:hypothetical protein [Armatimonadota bacterium]MDR7455614.1 hypothetical protein [Armatimonadota bacterium]MDR7457913.1 hypothetical protein [Armatimonadota bacterium]MDR7495903.1 hypothetical protein [Armatimonadota bacterium]MDR7511848.1 hypothetical protein [Armatimonadota bacterium]